MASLSESWTQTQLENITVIAKQGAINHGNPHLLCSPAEWTDILLFYLSNYLTHVGTVVTYPGESPLSTFFTLFTALLLPTAGVIRGLSAIVRCAKLQKSPLQIATRAGALCMVVRSGSWRIREGESFSQAFLRGPLCRVDDEVGPRSRSDRLGQQLHSLMVKHASKLGLPKDTLIDKIQGPKEVVPVRKNFINEFAEQKVFWPPWADTVSKFWHFYDTESGVVDNSRSIHGSHKLTEGYELAHVPLDAVVVPRTSSSEAAALAENYSLPKAISALVQLLFSTIQLNRAAKAEVDYYGFAAFSLTVAPYAVMSLVNLVANTLTPTYSALYMVHSEVMEEAIQRGSIFDGVVGSLVPEALDVNNAQCNCFPVTGSCRQVVKKGLALLPLYLRFEDGLLIRQENRQYPPKCSEIELVSSEDKTSLTFLYPFRPQARRRLQVSPIPDHAGGFKDFSHDGEWPMRLAPPALNTRLQADAEGMTSIMIPACPNFRRQSHRKFSIIPANCTQYDKDSHRLATHDRPANLATNMTTVASWIVGAVSIAIYGGLSGFQKGRSTVAERTITMIWLSFGIAMGPSFPDSTKMLIHYADDHWGKASPSYHRFMYMLSSAVVYMVLPIYGGASIAGFVIVGIMIKQWGNCVTLYRF